MRRSNWVILTALAFVFTSCGSTNYLANSTNYAPKTTSNLIQVKKSLERPAYNLEDISEDLIAVDFKEEEMEAEAMMNYLDRAVNNIIIEAKTYIGTPYRYGGTTRGGIDCSAFMQRIFEIEGIELPRVSKDQSLSGTPVTVEQLRRGDLVFFSTTSPRRITHVGMVTKVDSGEVEFIHASSSQGVTISSLSHNYWNSRFRWARRIASYAIPQFETAGELVAQAQMDSILATMP